MPFHGWIFLNKPPGLSSTHASTYVKKIVKQKKIGHVGTLDPLASGVLPLALGEATKTIPYFSSNQKAYTFDLIWGEGKDTDDESGVTIASGGALPSLNAIHGALPFFSGSLLQSPPSYSAVHIEGERAYALARKGKNFQLPAKEVFVESIEIISHSSTFTTFKVICGSGFYVRAFGRDLAIYLGTQAYVKNICRVQNGVISLKDTISLEKLSKIEHKVLKNSILRPVDAVLDDIPAVIVSALESERLRFGLPIVFNAPNHFFVRFYEKSNFLGIGKIENGQLYPKRLFHLT